jgi:general stress protein 26
MIDDYEALMLATRVIDEAFVGIMTTVDGRHAPVSRLMGAVADNDGLHRLFSLSAKDTRKVQHLENNPAVCWLFGVPPYETTVTLHGVAKRSETPLVPQSIWDRLADWARPYAANVLTDDRHHAFSVIVSNIHTLELLSPKLGIKSPHIIKLDRVEEEREAISS